MTLAQNSLNMSARLGTSATLVFFSLNDFKDINDKFGRAEGDKALIAFANLLKGSFREADVIARLGGDEFAALLTNTTKDSAKAVVDNFRGVIEEYNHKAKRGYEITFPMVLQVQTQIKIIRYYSLLFA